MNDAFAASDFRQCEDALRLAIDGDVNDAKLKTQLRSMVGTRLAAMVMATADLQSKARAKLGAGLWWCSERSLSQSTPYPVADLKATWIQSSVVFDLCSGIGRDTISIANQATLKTASITSVDLDPTTIAMATENLRLHSQIRPSPVCFRCQDVGTIAIPPEAAVHIDPDRRQESGRKTRPEDYSPAWDVVEQIIARCDATTAKLAPAAEIEDQSERHRLWISWAGSVREQTLLAKQALVHASNSLGGRLGESGRTAVILRPSGGVAVFSGEFTAPSGRRTEQPRKYLADPDPAIRAAGLTESFAEQSDYQLLGGPSGFLTGDVQLDADLAVCEPVIWSGSCDDRKLRKTLRSLNCFPWRVKTRGVQQNPNVLEKRYRECGEQPVTLWIGRATRRQFAVLTQSDAE